jgi:hypothetical protein
MYIWTRFSLAATITLMATGPTLAQYNYPVPEIDGPAGVLALAALVSVAMIAYSRLKR